jgi:hypothetical protein
MRAVVFSRTTAVRLSICPPIRGRDWTRLLDWGQLCSKTPADEFRPNDTRCDRTIQDNSRTFQQAPYAGFP